MKAAIAARVAAAVGAHIFDDGEIRAPADSEWSPAKVNDRRAGQRQEFGPEFQSGFVTGEDMVEFLLADWPVPSSRPGKGWLVRFADGRIVLVTEPARVKDGLALTAPVIPFTGTPPA